MIDDEATAAVAVGFVLENTQGGAIVFDFLERCKCGLTMVADSAASSSRTRGCGEKSRDGARRGRRTGFRRVLDGRPRNRLATTETSWSLARGPANHRGRRGSQWRKLRRAGDARLLVRLDKRPDPRGRLRQGVDCNSSEGGQSEGWEGW